jgi:glucose/arabinose dehydrogenase
MSLWARVPEARLALWAPDGTLIISQPNLDQVLRLSPDGSGGATQAVLLQGLTQPHGLAFHKSTLYVAESSAVAAYDYNNGKVTNRRVVVANLPDDSSEAELGGKYAHALKSIAVDSNGTLFITIGSTGNVSPQDRTKKPERAAVLRLLPGSTQLETFARGVRNGVGLAFAPNGVLWTLVNNRDNIQYPYSRPWGGDPNPQGKVLPDYVDDHPPELIASLPEGRDLGYPYCNADPDPQASGPGQTPVSSKEPIWSNDIEMNTDGMALNCSALKRIERTFGAHSAGLGLAFATLPGFGLGALIGAHGSWNRAPSRAPEVAFFPYNKGALGAQQTLIGGFQASSGARWGRPVAPLLGPDGALYVTDDYAGAVYRLTMGEAALPAPAPVSSPGQGPSMTAPLQASPRVPVGPARQQSSADRVAASVLTLVSMFVVTLIV